MGGGWRSLQQLNAFEVVGMVSYYTNWLYEIEIEIVCALYMYSSFVGVVIDNMSINYLFVCLCISGFYKFGTNCDYRHHRGSQHMHGDVKT